MRKSIFRSSSKFLQWWTCALVSIHEIEKICAPSFTKSLGTVDEHHAAKIFLLHILVIFYMICVCSAVQVRIRRLRVRTIPNGEIIHKFSFMAIYTNYASCMQNKYLIEYWDRTKSYHYYNSIWLTSSLSKIHKKSHIKMTAYSTHPIG